MTYIAVTLYIEEYSSVCHTVHLIVVKCSPHFQPQIFGLFSVVNAASTEKHLLFFLLVLHQPKSIMHTCNLSAEKHYVYAQYFIIYNTSQLCNIGIPGLVKNCCEWVYNIYNILYYVVMINFVVIYFYSSIKGLIEMLTGNFLAKNSSCCT